MAFLVNSANQASQVSNVEQEEYSILVSYLTSIRQLVEKGITITKLKEMYDAKDICNFSNHQQFPDSRTIDNCIKIIGPDLSNVTSTEDKPLYDAMNEIARNVTTATNGQVHDTESVVAFVSELIKQVNMQHIQGNTNNDEAMRQINISSVNLNVALNENAALKAQNEQLKQRLIALGQQV